MDKISKLNFYDIQQGSELWLQLRKGKFTASNFGDLFAKETTATYQNAIYKVVFELLTNESPESFSNDYMVRGNELESEAREVYEFETCNKVKNGGFMLYNNFVGASADGIINDKKGLEIKCPKYSTMINYLLKKELPSQYFWQVYGQMMVYDFDAVDFFAYHPKLKPLIVTVQRNEDILKELKEKLEICINSVQTIIKQLKET